MVGPDWEELRADGRVVWDKLPAYGLAVYAGAGGDVVVLSVEDGRPTYATVDPPEFAAFLAAFQRAMQEANEIGMEVDADYSAHLAIEKAKGQSR